jgi:signal transduction histidine kinase
MVARAKAINGRLSIYSSKDKGSVLDLKVPGGV